MYQNPYTLITAKYSVSDNYATQAKVELQSKFFR